MRFHVLMAITMAWLALGIASAEEAEALFRIKENGKWGFIDATGKIVIPPQYDDCYYQFSEGLAAVQIDRKRSAPYPPLASASFAFRFARAIAAGVRAS